MFALLIPCVAFLPFPLVNEKQERRTQQSVSQMKGLSITVISVAIIRAIITWLKWILSTVSTLVWSPTLPSFCLHSLCHSEMKGECKIIRELEVPAQRSLRILKLWKPSWILDSRQTVYNTFPSSHAVSLSCYTHDVTRIRELSLLPMSLLMWKQATKEREGRETFVSISVGSCSLTQH